MKPLSRNHRGPLAFKAAQVRLTSNPDGTLTLACSGRQLKNVRVRLGRPLLDPKSFASVLSEKGAEVGLITHLERLTPATWNILEAHVLRHDLTTEILKVRSLAHQYGSAYWDVETQKGRRQFVIRGTTEYVRYLDDDRLLITDVQGNRFEIPSLAGLDKRSRQLIELIL